MTAFRPTSLIGACNMRAGDRPPPWGGEAVTMKMESVEE